MLIALDLSNVKLYLVVEIVVCFYFYVFFLENLFL